MGGGIAAILALWAVLATFNIWFMVPLDPRLTQSQQMRMQLEYTVIFLGAVIIFAALSRFALRKAWNAPE